MPEPRRHEPDDTTPFGFGADAAPPPPPEPEPEPTDPSLAGGPKSRKKPRKADYRKVKPDPRYVDKLLEPKKRPPKAPWPEPPWWLVAEAFAVAGVLLGAIPVVQALHKVKTGATTGVFIGVILVAAVAIQTAASAGVLVAVGGWLGVEYGPPRTTIAKLAALSAFAVGLVVALLSVGGPVAALFAAVPIAAALAALFRLGLTDTVVSVIGYGLAAAGTAMVLFVGAVFYFR